MEFPQTFLDFLKILKESIKVLSRNRNLMGFVTIPSLLLPSILFFLYTKLFHYLINRNYMDDSFVVHLLQISILNIFNVIAFFLSCSIIFQFSSIATILVSASSYTNKDHQLSLKSLVLKVNATWRRQLRNSFSRERNATRLQLALGAVSDVAVCLMGTVLSPSFNFMAWKNSDWPMSSVVSVVEESSCGGEATEKARRLVESRGVHEVMHSMIYCGAMVGSTLIVVFGDAGPMIAVTRGMILLNLLSLGRMLWCVVHTVLYFQCKKEK